MLRVAAEAFAKYRSFMSKFKFNCNVKKLIADTITPVGIYLKLRAREGESFLLEGVDYRPNEKCFSFICCDPIAEIVVENEEIVSSFPDGSTECTKIEKRSDVGNTLKKFADRFDVDIPEEYQFLSNGLFGYSSYDAIRYFEEIDIQKDERKALPDIRFHIFRFVIAIDHFKNELFILENQGDHPAGIEEIVETLFHQGHKSTSFEVSSEETSNFTDDEFTQVIKTCQQHIQRGDVFQIVPSRRYERSYKGDEFNLYRALRSINPSPYLFFYDYGDYQIFGSSPEANLVVKKGRASLWPIAGTYKRSGDEKADVKAISELQADSKENAEHVMLVDLARNDLSKHCEDVRVDVYKEPQMYSHVIHLVSKVSGKISDKSGAFKLLEDTFPMGTLSGAPKYRALEIIDSLERGRRGIYGGAIGCIGFDGSCNTAIMIRTFVSQNGVLKYQAGMGIVADSIPESEIQEIHNKLGALTLALEMAEEIV